jgi:serine-type D-Ala-D-Ala carboxypeptidase/endopeptidase
MKRLQTTLSAIAAALALSGVAYAQEVKGIDGRWEGPVTLGNGMTITAVFRATTKDGVTTTVFDSPDQGAKDLPAKVKREGDTITFEIPTAQVIYTAKLSADGKTLTGDMSQGGGSVPLTMTQKPASAVAAITTPAVAGIDGNWEGSIDTPVGALGVIFRASTAAGKTTTLMDVPAQNATKIPVLAKRDGQKMTLEVPGVGGKFAGDLSADGKTLTGFWDQMGQSIPLTLAKK